MSVASSRGGGGQPVGGDVEGNDVADGETGRKEGREVRKDGRPKKGKKPKAFKNTVGGGGGAGWAAVGFRGGGGGGRPWVVGRILPQSAGTEDSVGDREKEIGGGESRVRKKKKAKEIAWAVKEVDGGRFEGVEQSSWRVDESESEWSGDQEGSVRQDVELQSSGPVGSGHRHASATPFRPVPPPLPFERSKSAGVGASGQGRSRARLLLDRDCEVRPPHAASSSRSAKCPPTSDSISRLASEMSFQTPRELHLH